MNINDILTAIGSFCVMSALIALLLIKIKEKKLDYMISSKITNISLAIMLTGTMVILVELIHEAWSLIYILLHKKEEKWAT